MPRYAYRKLKSNAKRRKIFFDLTLEQFRDFCVKTEILFGRGRYSESYHIDRKIDELGYTAGNLQKLTNAENIRKELQRRKRKIFDYELYHKRKIGALESEAEERISEFRFVDDSETGPDDAPPF